MKSVAQTFAKLYSNLAESLLKNLPNSPNKFSLNFVHQYYRKTELKNNFNQNLITEKKILEILQCIYVSKAVGIDKASGSTAQKIKFSIEDFFSKCDQIPRKLLIWSHLLR